jgi:hypothetical protein
MNTHIVAFPISPEAPTTYLFLNLFILNFRYRVIKTKKTPYILIYINSIKHSDLEILLFLVPKNSPSPKPREQTYLFKAYRDKIADRPAFDNENIGTHSIFTKPTFSGCEPQNY